MTKRVRSVPMKLTADSGAQVTACNVDKLSLLGLRRKDLLSTAVGLESVPTRRMRMFSECLLAKWWL